MTTVLIAGVALLVGGAVLGIALLVLSLNERRRVRRVTAERVGRPGAGPSASGDEPVQSGTLVAWVLGTNFGKRLSAMVADAELSFTAGRFLAYLALFAILGAAAGLLILGNPLTAVILAAAGLVLPLLWLKRQAEKRVDLFLDQLPEALFTIANAVKAGAGMIQAVEQAAEELRPPMSVELRQVSVEFRVGRPLEEALMSLRERMPVVELDSVIAALLIHRRSGGNLGELLSDMANLIKEDVQLKQEMRVQTAQAQLSARVVGIMPIAIFLWMRYSNPEFLAPLTSNWQGISLLVLAFGLEAVGFVVIQRLTVIEE